MMDMTTQQHKLMQNAATEHQSVADLAERLGLGHVETVHEAWRAGLMVLWDKSRRCFMVAELATKSSNGRAANPSLQETSQ